MSTTQTRPPQIRTTGPATAEQLAECAKWRAQAIEIGYRAVGDRLPPEMPANAQQSRVLAHTGMYRMFVEDYHAAAPKPKGQAKAEPVQLSCYFDEHDMPDESDF